ncbi:Ecdysteroid kinase-like family [Popillia japonica]|uniref:Ecdysteroid kinase-like family n=1 Tax=Popillia japonica TaxID=7064 RepID=A0AAW1JGY1_POPJA
MIDFQLIEYNSAANDVLFLLYSSVELSLLEKHVDDFLKMYHEYFIETLQKLDCDTAQFSYVSFLEECAKVVDEIQLAHLTFMQLRVLLGGMCESSGRNPIGSFNFHAYTNLHTERRSARC